MFVFDYKTDFDSVFDFIKPKITIRNLSNLSANLSTSEALLLISNWVSIDNFYEVAKTSNTCKYRGTLRKLIYQDINYLIQLQYPEPFTSIDWKALLYQPEIKLMATPEFFTHGDLRVILN